MERGLRKKERGSGKEWEGGKKGGKGRGREG